MIQLGIKFILEKTLKKSQLIKEKENDNKESH